MNLPKISVVTITYGHEKYIRETLDGVMMQQYAGPIEFIIANDNSPDQTDEVVKAYFQENPAPENFEIKYTRHPENKGMMPNFIWALEKATGKYIALCEGDDYWTDPMKLQKQVDILVANHDYVLTFHPVKVLHPDGTLGEDNITSVPENYEIQKTLAQEGNFIHTPSVLFRNIIHTYPAELLASPIGDYFLYMILTKYGKMYKMNDEMGVYRFGVGIFSGKSKIKKAKDSFKLLGLLLSWSDNLEINQIFLEKQIAGLDYYAQLVNENDDSPQKNKSILERVAAKFR